MFSKSNDTLRQILVISGLVMVLIVNGLANALPINNMTTGDISNQFSIYFVPAAYVFSIWGVIYLFQLAYIVYQALPSQKHRQIHRQIAPWYLLSSVANASWIFCWHYLQFGLSILPMLLILVSLIAIYLIINNGRFSPTPTEKWIVKTPFSLYFAWITVATIANITTWLDSIGWNGFGLSEITWGIIMLIVATVIESTMAVQYRDPAYVAVIVWAFVGIAVKQADTASVMITAVLMSIIVISAFIFGRTQKPKMQLNLSSG